MKRTLFFALLVCSLPALTALLGIYEHGTVIRMHMGECALLHPGFVLRFGGPQAQTEENCPEYTLVADQVIL